MYAVFQELLEENNVKVSDVSRATGVALSTISNWKTRDNYLSAENSIAIADYFNVSLNYLLTGKEFTAEKHPEPAYLEDKEFMNNVKRIWNLPKEYRNKIFEQLDLQELKYKADIEESGKKDGVLYA